jgi:hypothetical protein
VQLAGFDPAADRACCRPGDSAGVFHSQHGNLGFALAAPHPNSASPAANQNDFILFHNHLDPAPWHQNLASAIACSLFAVLNFGYPKRSWHSTCE